MNIKTLLHKLQLCSQPEINNICPHNSDNTYMDLAPKKDADISTYEDALIEAIENHRVYNIALTGPYGSGKSSIIETFEEKHNEYEFLNISLASFKEIDEESNKDSKATKNSNTQGNQAIEKSILQQMIYSQEGSKLPYSRFKRITKPERPLTKSIAFITWAVLGYFLNLNIEQLHDFSGLNWYETLAVFTIAFGFIVPTVFAAAALYKRTYTMSIKSISLTNTEISQDDNSEESILNKYLDEILYFFEETDYKVVVIEDLDRFGGNEIFIKLREINKLINSKKLSGNQIKFLYAIKDNMFSSVERSKFFEFIIPVIPIVNTSNSTDMMINYMSENDLHIDKYFIKDIGLYINDQRLINNIFNEFKIYTKKINSDKIIPTKLFAIITYKNLYPSDFENLHHKEGFFYKVLKESKIKKGVIIKELKSQIDSKELSIKNCERENFDNINELSKLYALMLFSKISEHQKAAIEHITIENTPFNVKELGEYKNIIKIITTTNFNYTYQDTHYNRYRNGTLNISFKSIENDINPDISFSKRIEKINIKNNRFKSKYHNEIKELDNKIKELNRSYLLKDRISRDLLEKIEGKPKRDTNLLFFLILNGYLDDNYHDYISFFHEGNISENDRQFRLNMRNNGEALADQKLDNPTEAIESMQDADFSSIYALNTHIFNELLKNTIKYSRLINLSLDFINENSQASEEFLYLYMSPGNMIDIFISKLFTRHPDFLWKIINTSFINPYIIKILSNLKPFELEKVNDSNTLTSYLNLQGEKVLNSDLFSSIENFSILDDLNLEINDISIINSENLIKHIYENNLFEINNSNILIILNLFGEIDFSEDDFNTSNYTTILKSKAEYLKDYILENITTYVKKVFFSNENRDEKSQTIIKLLNDIDFDYEDRQKILTWSHKKIETEDLSEVPEELWDYIFSENKITQNWKNISNFISQEEYKKEPIIEYLTNNIESWNDISIKTSITDENKRLELSKFLFNLTELEDEIYEKTINRLPYYYRDFPSDSTFEKDKILIESKTVRLNEESFNNTNNIKTKALLIINNFSLYIESKNKDNNYELDNNTIQLILESELKFEDKIEISKSINYNHELNKNLLKLLLPIANNEIFPLETIPNHNLLELISINRNSELSASIITKLIDIHDKDFIISSIKKLAHPICDIAYNGKKPSISNTIINKSLVENLKRKSYISSFTEKKDKLKIYTFNS